MFGLQTKNLFTTFMALSLVLTPAQAWAQKAPPKKRTKKPSTTYFALGKMSAKGSISQASIRRKMRKHHKRFVRLFLTHFAKKNPRAAGTIHLKWLIMASGRVIAKITKPRAPLGAAFEKGLVSIFRHMRFVRNLPCGVVVIKSALHFSMIGLSKK